MKLSIQLKFTENEAFKGFFVEINLRKKWLLCCSYNPNKKKLPHLQVISKAQDDLARNIIILSYWVISTMNKKKPYVKFPKSLAFKKYSRTKELFQKPR